jgi:hypothetical protein
MLILRPKYIQMPPVKILQTHNGSVLASAMPTKHRKNSLKEVSESKRVEKLEFRDKK